MHKKTKDMSAAEIELAELFELVGDLKRELKEIKAIANDAFLKANISHSLIVIRKIGEDRVDELKRILD